MIHIDIDYTLSHYICQWICSFLDKYDKEGVKEFNSYYYGHSDIFLTEHKDEKFYLITDGFSPLALRSLDGITKFILNPTKLMDNDVYLFNKYRITREKLISLINEEFRSKKLERRK